MIIHTLLVLIIKLEAWCGKYDYWILNFLVLLSTNVQNTLLSKFSETVIILIFFFFKNKLSIYCWGENEDVVFLVFRHLAFHFCTWKICVYSAVSKCPSVLVKINPSIYHLPSRTEFTVYNINNQYLNCFFF